LVRMVLWRCSVKLMDCSSMREVGEDRRFWMFIILVSARGVPGWSVVSG